MNKIGKIDKLKNLFNFIDGKITHYYVEPRYLYDVPEIIKFSQTDKKYGADFKLLSLVFEKSYGKGGYNESRVEIKDIYGDFHWSLEGDSGRKCIPCLSYEEALDHLKKYISSKVKYWENGGPAENKVINVAKEYKCEIPDGYINAVKDYERNKKLEEIEKHKKFISNLMKEVS